MIEYLEAYTKERHSKPKSSKSLLVYKLGEEIANGIRYFGADSRNKKGDKIAKCICPVCGDACRVLISSVKNGSVKSCCHNNKAPKQESKLL